MTNFKSAEEVLDFAIAQEEISAQFYSDLARKVERPAMSKVFAGFAKEEMGHKKKLEGIKGGKTAKITESKVMDLKMSDYLIDVEPSPDLDYQDALILAMKKEKAAFRLYSDLAQTTDDEELRSVFQLLAQEEAKHKLRFEIEYDDNILTEN